MNRFRHCGHGIRLLTHPPIPRLAMSPLIRSRQPASTDSARKGGSNLISPRTGLPARDARIRPVSEWRVIRPKLSIAPISHAVPQSDTTVVCGEQLEHAVLSVSALCSTLRALLPGSHSRRSSRSPDYVHCLTQVPSSCGRDIPPNPIVTVRELRSRYDVIYRHTPNPCQNMDDQTLQ